RTAGGENLLGQIGWRVGQWGRGLHQRGSGGGDRRRVARPDQDSIPLIDRHALALNEFVLYIIQGRIVELKLPLEGAVRHPPPALEHSNRLVEDLLKGHRPPSLRRGGVEQTVWELARPVGRMYTAPGGQKKAAGLAARHGAVPRCAPRGRGTREP